MTSPLKLAKTKKESNNLKLGSFFIGIKKQN